MSSIHELSWNETSFWAKLQLFFKSRKLTKVKIKAKDPLIQAEGYSELSSTYLTIANTGYSHLKSLIDLQPFSLPPLSTLLWPFTWLPLSVWCYWRMLPLSNSMFDRVKVEDMTVNQLDIHQTILRARNSVMDLVNAEQCIRAALNKKPEKPHILGLLHVGLADVFAKRYMKEGEYVLYFSLAEENVRLALLEAMRAETEDVRQAARIYRKCADIKESLRIDSYFTRNRLREHAKELLEEVGAKDQLLKI